MKHENIYGDVDWNTLNQFRFVMQQENVIGGALMPDAHLGYTMPIGGVALVDGAVYPTWVGYDIGCGVCAIKIKEPTPWVIGYIRDNVQLIYDTIKEKVPSKEHKHHMAALPDTSRLSDNVRHLVEERSAYKQLGTIGSGNHFIELCYDIYEGVWIVIHSGSRGIGHGIAGYWMNVADQFGPSGMGFFKRGTEEHSLYLRDQDWCIDYALTNRLTMLKIIEDELSLDLDWDTLINKVHNNVEVEYGKGTYLHRKGATSAREGEFGVIPGNMRDGSVIVKGLGNEASYCSCSHGAGRSYSRGKAKRELSLETFHMDMEGIACYVAGAQLDECPAAYKNFENVMDAQKDLCTIERYLKPLINIKG